MTDHPVLHLIGDVHVGAIPSWRLEAVIDDFAAGGVPTPSVHIQLGDLTNDGLPQEDADAEQWMARLPAPVHVIPGNHDIHTRSPHEWARTHGRPGPNFVEDLGFAHLVVVSPHTSMMWPLAVSAATLDWLDRTLREIDGPCIIGCHAPLSGTVGGNEDLHFTSATDGFWIEESDELRDVMSRNRNVVLFLSGHTHSPLDVGVVTELDFGFHTVTAINGSSLYYTGRVVSDDSPLMSLFVTYCGDRVEVRFRDHVARTWAAPTGAPVVVAPIGPNP